MCQAKPDWGTKEVLKQTNKLDTHSQIQKGIYCQMLSGHGRRLSTEITPIVHRQNWSLQKITQNKENVFAELSI